MASAPFSHEGRCGGQIVANPRKGRCVPCPVTPEGVCVAAICRYTSLVCSVVQEYGAAARRRRSKWRHDSAPMNQNSTAAHRPAAPLTTAPDTARGLQIIQIEILTVTPPVILTMKIRHLNPRQMVSIPEQRVTVRHPVLKAPPGKMRHTAELVNRPRQTSHHGKSLCTCSRRSASLSRADHRGGCGPAPQSHPAFLPAASPPETSGNTPPAHRRYSRRENIFPLRRSHHEAARLRWRTSLACARIADSVSVMGFTAKVC